MTRIFVAGFQHETNTFGPSKADWAAFTSGSTFPAARRGPEMLAFFAGVNAPISGFAKAAQGKGWSLWPSLWAGAAPSSYVTQEAFEHIAQTIVDDVRTAHEEGIDGIYLDLHGAAVAEHVADAEGELLRRIRAIVGDDMPMVASLDLHANVTPEMLQLADALTSYRTYPHVDAAETGARAADLLQVRLLSGIRQACAVHQLDYLIPLPAQSTWNEPAASIYAPMAEWDAAHGATVNFCMGFPAADFVGCRPVMWAYAQTPADAQAALDALRAVGDQRAHWRSEIEAPDDSVAHALRLAAEASQPVVIADTEDNSGAGADSNTTGMAHALLRAGAGRAYPQRVVVGLLCDPEAAARAHAAGVGARIDGPLGKAVPTYAGHSDAPLDGPFTVRALSDGVTTLKGPMMTGMQTSFGLSACLEQDGVLIAVVSGKAQLLDREMLRMVGVTPEDMAIIVVKSSNHFRADFTPIASHVLVAKALGPMAADPGDLPWQHLSDGVARRP
jgi:microcystin degradation protein MlrC